MSEKKQSDISAHHQRLAKYNINPKYAMITLVLSVFVDVLGYSLVLPLLPRIAKIFGASDIMVGVLISSNAFSALLFAPLWGKLSDRFGRKPILIISQAGTLSAFLFLGFSDNLILIFASRILDGIFGGQFPVIKAYISDITTPKTRTGEIGKIMVGASIGMILGPTIGGLLGVINWRYPPLVASTLAVISIILAWRVLVESMPLERREDIIREKKEREQEVELQKVWSGTLVLRLVQRLFIFLITVMFNSSIALVIDKRYGGGPDVIGLVMTVGGIFAIIYGGFLMKRLIRYYGEKQIFIFAMILVTSLCLIYPFLFELWMVFIFIIPFAFCMAFLPALVQANITKAVDEDQQGIASGWSTNIQSIAQTLAPLIATGFLQIGGLTLTIIRLNSYHLIGFTAAVFGGILLTLSFYDLRQHPNLYEENKRCDQ